MWKKYKKRLVAIVCIVSMLCSIGLSRIPALAEGEGSRNSNVITLDNAPEKEFASWTFSDAAIPNGEFDDRWDGTNHTTGNTLDMSLFQGKIKFPTVKSEFIIGQNVDSRYNGFRFISDGTNLSFAFSGVNSNYYNENGNTGGQAGADVLATFDKDIAGIELIDNQDLEVAVSVEYTYVKNGLVTMKVGVFFNGVLYNNTYFTVKDVPEEYLTQTIRFYNSDTSVKWNAESIITLDSAPENEFAHWTFSDINFTYKTFGSVWSTSDLAGQTPGDTLDKTIFQGKINFPEGGDGQFFIGGINNTENWRGFRFLESGTNLTFAFQGPDGTLYDKDGATNKLLATFAPETAGTTLVGNEDLEVAVSVEYTSDTTDGVTMKVGVFFNGRLYNGTYYTVKNAPKKYLTQAIRFYKTIGPKWSTESIITLDTAPENKFTHWTFSDVNIPDGQFGNRWNANEHTNGKSLDETIFQGKIKFPTVQSEFIIGQNVESNYNGFRFFNTGSALSLLFRGTSETATTLVTFDPKIAGTELINNQDLEVAVSVEYTSETETAATLKVGVFFNGRLYNGTYLTVNNVPVKYLTQTIRFQNSNTSVKWYAESIKITLDTALESKFTRWTFSDVNIPNGPFGNRWNANEHTNEKSLNKTLFQGKIKFPTVQSEFIIGQNVESNYNGFRFYNTGSALSLLFRGTSEAHITLATFDPEIAGTELIDNQDLEVAVSVEYTSIKGGNVTMKVGVFFDGRLYNDTYITVKDVPEKYLTQTIRFQNTNTSVKWSVESLYTEESGNSQITLDTAPEKDFACWTFSDCRIEDQTLTSNLNWEDDFKDQTLGTSLNETIFNGKVNFSADSPHFGNFYIGGASANDASKWRGFVFLGDGSTSGLRLFFQGAGGQLYNASGNTGSDNTGDDANAIAVFNPITAGTTLRGNSALRLSFSVEYVETTDTAATLKVGVFFDGNLYDNTYYTVKDVPIDYLNQNVRFNIGSIQTNAVASQHMEQCEAVETERITLDNAPEKDFACWTFSDAGLDDQQLYGNLNWGDAYKNYTIGASLDKTIFNGKIKFASGTTNFGNFYIGGASANDASKWRGFVFLANGTEGLNLCFMGSNGLLYNANGNTQGDNTNNLNYAIATFNSNNAGTTLRGNKDLQVSLSVEYMETTNTTANLKVGVFFDGVLYNNTYYTVKDVPLEYLNQNVRFYVTGEENGIASHHLCGKVDVKTEIKVHSTYEELTLHDFSIYDTKVEKFAEGAKEFRLENYYDKASLDGIAFSAICNFPKKSEARFSLGGSFWRGVYFRSLNDGRIEVSYVDKAGDARTITRISADKAGTDAVLGKDITLRITFDITETGNGKADMRVGIYVNGKLYEGKHYIVRNIDTETMTRTMKLYVTEVPFEIKSVPITIDLSIYGFDNKTWKDKI